jgi:hypothetical protein
MNDLNNNHIAEVERSNGLGFRGRRGLLSTVGLLTLVFFAGCGASSNNFASLQRNLASAIERFENAEANFSSSATYDQLIVNAGWLDRMAEEVVAIQRIEAKAVAMGSDPIPEIREEVAERFRRRFAALQSDAKYLDVMSQLEIARIWTEI